LAIERGGGKAREAGTSIMHIRGKKTDPGRGKAGQKRPVAKTNTAGRVPRVVGTKGEAPDRVRKRERIAKADEEEKFITRPQKLTAGASRRRGE